MKSYTDLEQSKKLAEILPLESADMCWEVIYASPKDDIIEYADKPTIGYIKHCLPAWSLAALLDVLPKKYYPIKDHETDLIIGKPKDKWCVIYWDDTGMQDGEQTLEYNLVDACVAIIEKLHEQNLL